MPPFLLSIKNLSVHFDGTKILDNVNFDISKNETLGLFGKSGSGKTTIGRCISRLENPTCGEILFEEKDIIKMNKKEFSKLRPKIQMIFQHPETSLNPRMKVFDSIVEPLMLMKIKKNNLHSEIQALLDIVGLRMEHMDRFPGQLSGGEIQRIVLARILSLKPKFIVADEPTSMLDVSAQAQILRLMEKVQSETGVSYLFISHEIEVLRAVCDQIAYLENGCISKIEKVTV
jgi:peptide/nickel transport system ATP-binding protein